jgi:DNA uptake protein ComE-like DNA-binding protein
VSPSRKRPDAPSPGTEEWLAIPGASPSRAKPKRARPKPAKPKPAASEAPSGQRKRSAATAKQSNAKVLTQLAERLKRVEARQTKRVDELEQRLGRIEEAIQQIAARLDTPPASTRPSAAALEPAELPDGPLDLNAVEFEQLRALGLSTAESARLVAVREVRGGFKSLDELDDLDGFTEKQLTRLKARLRV